MPTLDIAHQRLHNQRLVGAPFERPNDVVRWLGAVQAQDYAGAKWAVAQRTPGASNAGLDRVFEDGGVLRTHVMRPTWHFVLPADIRWLLALTGPRVQAVNAHYDRKLELDDAVFGRSNDLLAAALVGGRQLTRAELGEVLAAGGISASGQRLGYLMMRAELDGVVCSGGRRGKQFTYALLDKRAPAGRELGREEALAELTRRYVVSHGPATVHDFAWWSGLTVADAKVGIALVGGELLSETVEGTTYWFSPPAILADEPSPVVHLLPNYDEHLVAYKDHRASFDGAVWSRLTPEEPALMGHIVVVDGLVVGGWRRTERRGEVTVTTTLLVGLSEDERAALRDAAARYGRFVGLPVVVEGG